MERTDLKSGHLYWSSIFSGAFITLGFMTFFVLLGSAISLGFNNVMGAPGGGNVFWSFLYSAITLVLSYFLGAYLGTRTREIGEAGSGSLHGLVSWGLATVIALAAPGLASPDFAARIFAPGTTVSWLAVCIVGVGAIAALFGGLLGKLSVAGAHPGREIETESRVA